MPNTINDRLIERMYAQAVQHLRQRASLLKYIRKEDPMSSTTPSSRGQTITIPIPANMSDATDVSPSSTPAAGEDITPTFALLTLDQWKRKGFAMTDAEYYYVTQGVMDGQFRVCIDKLAKAVMTNLFANYTSVADHVGTAGTAPFASSTVQAQDAATRLNINGVPEEDRAIVLGPYGWGNALGLGIFQQYLQRGDTQTFREARIGRALGFDWDYDLYVPRHTAGTLVNGSAAKVALVNNGGGYAAGVSTIAVDHTTLTGTVVVGDVFKFAGHDTHYRVTANATASSNAIASLQFSPALEAAVANDEALTFQASHTVNLAFHRDAFAFASRPLNDIEFKGGSEILAIPDPETGLTLRMEVSRQNKQTLVDFDILYGSCVVQAKRAVRIMGS